MYMLRTSVLRILKSMLVSNRPFLKNYFVSLKKTLINYNFIYCIPVMWNNVQIQQVTKPHHFTCLRIDIH